ncbi:MAG: outer membrane beta-barrel protein [Candidatus Krumholzibacteria bacterium]|nr:outer membrane beta-barrel protein [Candidatus Krumholzibacteria bacterium]
MKKLIALAIVLVVTAASVPAEAGFSVKLKGGYTYISYGDFNDWVDNTNREIPSGNTTIDNINWLPEVTAELIFPILPAFSGGVGIGYLSGKSDYSVSLGAESFSYIHKVKAMPVLLNVYWEPPLVSINPFVYGGVGFYRTSLEFDYWLTSGGDREGYNSEMDKWGFGLQAGGGIRIALMPTMSFDVGVQGRWADISGIEGTATSSDGETVDVYLARGEDYFGPEEKGAGEPEASVDLSGYTIFIGLTFGF